MKKIALAFGLLGLATFANAADALNGTVWQTIDDETKQPKAVVKFTEQKNGSLNATITKYLVADQENACSKCQGAYHNKPLKGITIVRNLKSVGGSKYDNGSIVDPKSGKTYKMKAEITDGGKKLTVRGYVGIAALGRNQTWVRIN